jgi:hypothetical protein
MLNNIYLLFLPAHCSHVLQPLDLGCFSCLKMVYRALIGEYTALLGFYLSWKAMVSGILRQSWETSLRKENIRSGWQATSLWPVNINKLLTFRWVVTPKEVTPPLQKLTILLHQNVVVIL